MIEFVAHGMPATQGSARAFRAGSKLIVRHDAEGKLKSWRSVVACAAREAMGDREPIDGPVAVHVTFYLPRPKSAPKSRLYPDRKPDLDKLARAVGDAIEGIVYTQDSRVCEWRLQKRYSATVRADIVVEEMA